MIHSVENRRVLLAAQFIVAGINYLVMCTSRAWAIAPLLGKFAYAVLLFPLMLLMFATAHYLWLKGHIGAAWGATMCVLLYGGVYIFIRVAYGL